MNMNRKAIRITACCVAATLTLAAAPAPIYAAPLAGVSSMTAQAASANTANQKPTVAANEVPFAGVSLTVSDYLTDTEAPAEGTEAGSEQAQDTPAEGNTEVPELVEPKNQSGEEETKADVATDSEVLDKENPEELKDDDDGQPDYSKIAVAQVDNFVNVRDKAGEDGEVVGKLYNNSAATVEAVEGDWSKITSGSVTGYVKSEFVVTGDEELAKSVSRRVATVNTVTLKVRTEPSTDASVLGLIGQEEELTIEDESIYGWVKVSIEEGDGWVSTEFVDRSTEFVQAESKAEEEARLAKEEAERQAAAEAAAKKTSSSKSEKSSSGKSTAAPSGSGGSAVANFASQFVGNPYVFGGSSLTNGADCSGFVMAVYANFGVGLPHSSAALRGVGYGVSLGEIQPGDIVCYSGHVGIYVGNNTIVHASTEATGIKFTSPVAYREVLAVRRIF